jgi:Putative inner membrane protein (DUF1819)
MRAAAQITTDSYQRSMDRYDTGVITGALLWEDSKILATLLLSNHSPDQIREAVVSHNPLLRRSKKRSLNVASYLLQRLKLCPKSLLELIAAPDSVASRQATFISALISSRFLRDFLNEVISDRLDSFDHHLPSLFWDDFWSSCLSKESSLQSLRPKGVAEIRSTLLKFLVEVGILETSRSRELHRIRLVAPILLILSTSELEWIAPYLRGFLR